MALLTNKSMVWRQSVQFGGIFNNKNVIDIKQGKYFKCKLACYIFQCWVIECELKIFPFPLDVWHNYVVSFILSSLLQWLGI